jgi:uncharacterized protein
MNATNHCFPQEGTNLGERVFNIFKHLFGDGFQRVVLIGSDMPHMPIEWIDEAFARLAHVDVVFAPADDGGYNLVGLKQPHDLFTNMAMSTPRLLEQTLDQARRLGLSVHLLPTTFDVDEIGDVEKLRRFLVENKDPLTHTRRVLST